MSVETTNNRKTYVANGISDTFATTFQFLEPAELVVIVDYTVLGGNGATGSVVFAAPPEEDFLVTIYNEPVIYQPLDLVEGDISPAEAKERAYDRLTMVCQRLRDKVDRLFGPSEGTPSDFIFQLPNLLVGGGVLSVNPEGTAIDMGPLLADRVGKYAGWDEDGHLIAVEGNVQTVPVTPAAATLLDDVTIEDVRETLGFNGENEFGDGKIELDDLATELQDATSPPGEIRMMGGSAVPHGHLACDGTPYLKATYPALWQHLSNGGGVNPWDTFGGLSAPAAGYFRVPHMSGRSPIGIGLGVGLATTRSIGTAYGAESHQIASAELPSHVHSINHGHTGTTTFSGLTSTDGDHQHKVWINTQNIDTDGVAFNGGGMITNFIEADNMEFIAAAAQGQYSSQQCGYTGDTWQQIGLYNYVINNSEGEHHHSVSGSGTATIADHTGSSGNGGFANTAMSLMHPVAGVNFVIKT
jgi:microcystin-dependent protein